MTNFPENLSRSHMLSLWHLIHAKTKWRAWYPTCSIAFVHHANPSSDIIFHNIPTISFVCKWNLAFFNPMENFTRFQSVTLWRRSRRRAELHFATTIRYVFSHVTFTSEHSSFHPWWILYVANVAEHCCCKKRKYVRKSCNNLGVKFSAWKIKASSPYISLNDEIPACCG